MTALPRIAVGDDYEELDFRIIQEGWNQYQLGDGCSLRARILLTRIFRNPIDPQNLFFDIFPPIFMVSAPIGLRGPRQNNSPGELARLPSHEVNIISNNEIWDRYQILRTNQIIRLRIIVTEIRRIVGRFDEKGLPRYIINSGPTVVVSNPDEQDPLP